MPSIDPLGILVGPSLAKQVGPNLSNFTIIGPTADVAGGTPATLWQLTIMFDQSPAPNVIATRGGGPVIKDDLAEHFPAVIVQKMIELDQIDLSLADGLGGGRPAQARDPNDHAEMKDQVHAEFLPDEVSDRSSAPPSCEARLPF